MKKKKNNFTFRDERAETRVIPIPIRFEFNRHHVVHLNVDGRGIRQTQFPQQISIAFVRQSVAGINSDEVVRAFGRFLQVHS